MNVQAPLDGGAALALQSEAHKGRRSPIEEPASNARKLTKRSVPSPRRPPSSPTKAQKVNPWAAVCCIHLTSFSASAQAVVGPGVADAPGQMPAREGAAVRTSVMTYVVVAILVANRQVRSVVGK